METVLIVSITAITVVFSFMCGLIQGQKIQRGERIELPRIEPIKAIKEHAEEKKAKEEREALNEWAKKMEEYDPRNVVIK